MLRLTPPRLIALLWLVALALTIWRFSPPELASDDTPHFAGQHAHETLTRILPDDRPHPLGSPAQDEMRERVVAELRALDLDPQWLSGWACSPFGECGYVHDIIVEIPGAASNANDDAIDAIAFVAHTDSALAGPGAGDDTHAVAILLELARHIQRGMVTPDNTILLVFTDGEEEGLLGATLFAERSPLAARTKVAVNLEARGNAGTSMLFQILGDSAWLIDAYAAHARAPYCSSLAQPVYERMPNFTDLSALHWSGIPGVDLAFIDGFAAYHSPLDTVQNLSTGAFQSQGDNALAMLRGLGSAELSAPPRGDAAWFDVLGLFVVRAPRGLMLPLALLLWLATIAAAVLAWRKGRTVPGSIAKAIGLALLSYVLIAALGYGLCASVIALSGEARPWSAEPWPLTAALVLLAPMVQVGVARWAKPGDFALLLGNAVVQTSFGLAVAYLAPAATYVFLVPALVLALLGPALMRGSPVRMQAMLPWVCVGVGLSALILWLPLIHGLRLALEPGVQLSLCAALASGWMWACYEDAGSGATPGLGILVLLGAAATLMLEPYTQDTPRREWLSAVAKGAEVTVVRGPGPTLDPRLRIRGKEVTDAARREVPELLDALAAAKPPKARVLQRGEQELKVRVRSRRGAPSLIVSIPAGAKLRALEVEDAQVPAKHIHDDQATRVEIHNVPDEGVTLTATLDNPALAWRIADRLWWLDAPAVLRSPDAQRSWDGDTTWVVADFEP